MARRLNMVFLAAIAIVVLVQNSAAQTTHTVGDSTGWTIPSGGAAFYTSWAANKTFSVGDILVFNFANGQHDVAKVPKADYDSCSSTNPISVATTSPARITVNTSGEHYFICNFPGHCSAGQQLMINVRAATSPSPAPQPSSPAPQPSSPSPTPVPSAPQPSSPSPTPVPSAPQPSSPSPTPVPSPAPRPSSPAPQPSFPSPTPVPSSAPSNPPPPASGPSPPSPPPGSPPPTSSPPPSSTTPPPSPGVAAPPPNSATSLGVTGLFTSFLAIFVALLY